MAIGYNLSYFNGKKVRDFNPGMQIEDPTGLTLRVRTSYDEENNVPKKLEALVADPKVGELPALVIGMWSAESEGSQPVIDQLIAHKDKFSSLRHLFFGDITFEESEISWIENEDMTALLNAFPELETLTVRWGGHDAPAVALPSSRPVREPRKKTRGRAPGRILPAS
ncbi:MAG: hypothetical protein AAF570_07590 [Bacteroidota bacterium]